MLVKKTRLIFTTALIFLAACKKNADNDPIVFAAAINDQYWEDSGIMLDLKKVEIDVSQLATISYSYLTVEERFSGTDFWEEIPIMDLAAAISNNPRRNIYTVDLSSGRIIRVYNFVRRAGTVSVRIRAYRRQ